MSLMWLRMCGRACLGSASWRVMCWLLSALALCTFIPGGVSAEAKPYRLAVLELGIDDVDDALARSLTESMRKQLKTRSEFVVSDTRVSLEQLSLAHDCDAEQASCLERIAKGLEVDGFVFGRLTNETGATMARLRRFDVATHAVNNAALATLATRDGTPEQVDHKAGELIDNLFELRAARSPFARGELKPRDAADKAASVPVAAGSEHKQKLSTRQLTGYALLGGAVLSAGLSVLSFVEIDRAGSNDTFDRYRRAVGQLRPGVRDVCDEASAGQPYGLDSRSLERVQKSCGTGRTFEVLQFVFIGGAVISSGLSAFLLLGSNGDTEKPLLGSGNFSLYPSVQKRGVSLGARFKF
jgi:hypothetical protein